MNTHETYLAKARDAILTRYMARPGCDLAVAQYLASIKVLYGAGSPGLRGVCYFEGWHNGQAKEPLIEVTAYGEEDRWQLAGTLAHELAHAAAGWKAGHGKEWKEWADRLGLRLAKAAGHVYLPACFPVDLRQALNALPDPTDGAPGLKTRAGWTPRAAPPCPMSIGVRGGRSRGPGSGSRLRKYVCECARPVIIRASTDELLAHCDLCGCAFKRA